MLELLRRPAGRADRYLLAAVSLFSRPVPADAVLSVAGHEAFGGCLAGWTERWCSPRCGRLPGWLLAPGRDLSAHPLVRDTFRPLVRDAAEAAAETVLTGMPAGEVTSARALRVVEAVELLLDADQWAAADDLYRSRAGHGGLWITLPAARLGSAPLPPS